MSIGYRGVRSTEEATLMNARKKEKKQLLVESKKPTCLSEWVALADEMKKHYLTHTHLRSKNDFARYKRYPPYKFFLWGKESQVFGEALEFITYLCAQRRDEYMDQKDKLYLQYLKQLPQYDFEFAEYESEKEKQKNEAILSSKQSIIYYGPQVAETEEGKKFQQKKKDKK